MAVKIVLAKAHEQQISDPEIQKERNSIEEELNRNDFEFSKDTVSVVIIKGIYKHDERRMTTACVFINHTEHVINEIKGQLKLAYKNTDAKIASATIDFDPQFLGELKPGEGLLVHLHFPVKGLTGDRGFSHTEIEGQFVNVRLKEEPSNNE